MATKYKKQPLKINRSQYFNKANLLREDFAKSLASLFLKNFNKKQQKELVSSSFLGEHVDTFPAENSLEIIAFNLYLINQIIEHLLSNSKTSSDLLFISAYVAEISSHDFINPRNTSETIRFLAPSKNLGYFFTPPEIAMQMAEEVLQIQKNNLKLLDPCAGYGVLAGTVIILAAKKKIQIDSITAIEIDTHTLSNLTKILSRINELEKTDININLVNSDALDFLANNTGGIFESPNLFDAVIINPPYGKLRFLKDSLTNTETKVSTSKKTLEEQAQEQKKRIDLLLQKVDAISKQIGLTNKVREYSKIFFLLSVYSLEKDGRLVIISPSTWMSDQASKEIRDAHVANRFLEKVILVPEKSGVFTTVNQHTSIAVISKKENQGVHVSFWDDFESKPTGDLFVTYHDLVSLDPMWKRIPRFGKEDYEIFKKMKTSNPLIKTLGNISNLRGELDLTLNKDLVTQKETSLRVIRGDHITRFQVHSHEKSEKDGFVRDKEFKTQFQNSPKLKHTKSYRIVGRQCSYINQKRRLIFALLEPGSVVSNSCNYITLDEQSDKTKEELQALLGILNSSIVEWYFRLYNNNNHVSNYEIDDIPVCLENHEWMPYLIKSTEFIRDLYNGNIVDKQVLDRAEDFHDALVGIMYGLSPLEITRVMEGLDSERSEHIANIAKTLINFGPPADMLKSQGWFNHYVSGLSDLDKEIIRHVPIGGNWQDIPESVPSKRLEQIREMSKERGVVRTTYYGRLRPDQPSYTIATYYNRPGNGTNIHPFEDRTITSREAARLQSFPDHYVFYGTEGSIRNQIGNAVPPLLAYALGHKIGEEVGYGTCVDAFAGAGGLSVGLEMAGWKSIAANDNDRHASLTYVANRPSELEPEKNSNKTFYLEGDIFDQEVQDQFIKGIKFKLKGKQLDLLAGGPPCQGFSHAGFRKKDDKRNNLASVYLELAKVLKPKTFVLENVEGLLSYNNGQVVQDLIKTLKEMGYKIDEPWVLAAEEFGVPQMRRRVLLVANRGKVITPPTQLFQKCPGRRKKVVDNQHLPLPINVTEAFYGLPILDPTGKEPAQTFRTEFAHWSMGKLPVNEMLDNLTGFKGNRRLFTNR